MILVLLAPLLTHAAEIQVAESGDISNPVWSSDGSWLAVEQLDASERPQILLVPVAGARASGPAYTVSLPGGDDVSITTTGAIALDDGSFLFQGRYQDESRLYYIKPGTPYAAHFIDTQRLEGSLTQPSLSDDGTQITFVAGSEEVRDIYTWERSSNTVTAAGMTPELEYSPVFSPAGVLTYSQPGHDGMDIYAIAGENRAALVSDAGDQIRPRWSGSQLIYFSSARGDGRWDILSAAGDAPPETLASDVRLPERAAPALCADGQWLAYGSTELGRSDVIEFVRLDGSQRATFQSGHDSPGEPALIRTEDRTWLAYTARSAHGSNRRSLHVADVTEHLP
jgi:Tol biopolymer transport system component